MINNFINWIEKIIKVNNKKRIMRVCVEYIIKV